VPAALLLEPLLKSHRQDKGLEVPGGQRGQSLDEAKPLGVGEMPVPDAVSVSDMAQLVK
jgi:hypothetical protein